MRVLYFGRDELKNRISVADETLAINVLTDITSKIPDFRFDLAIIDMLAEHAEIVCAIVKERLRLPLVLVVKEKKVDWQRMDSLGPQGFLIDTESEEEMAARVKTVVRRLNTSPGPTFS
jgi:hypothetical protein